MDDVLIETVGLTKRYGSRVAVDHVEMRVQRGEVYGYIGPNGAGKTTAIRLLLGLVRPSAGAACVLGRAPGDPAALARIGVLVESPALYPYLSGRDNLRVFARHAGVPAARIDEVLEAVALTGRAGDRAADYSLGMKQRLGVAVALLKDPALLVLDEPTNGLDPAGQTEMRQLLRRLAAEGRTVLLSSHQLGDVQQICDRIGVIVAGRLLREGTIAEVCGRGSLRVVAEPLANARCLAEHLLGRDKVAERDGALHLDVAPHEAPEVNRRLVLAGISVRGLDWHERSLEEVFFELMTAAEEGDR